MGGVDAAVAAGAEMTAGVVFCAICSVFWLGVSGIDVSSITLGLGMAAGG